MFDASILNMAQGNKPANFGYRKSERGQKNKSPQKMRSKRNSKRFTSLVDLGGGVWVNRKTGVMWRT